MRLSGTQSNDEEIRVTLELTKGEAEANSSRLQGLKDKVKDCTKVQFNPTMRRLTFTIKRRSADQDQMKVGDAVLKRAKQLLN